MTANVFKSLACSIDLKAPAVIAVVDHLSGHSPVDADVFPGDESGFVGTEIQDHMGYVHRISDTSGRLLDGIRALIDRVIRVNPAR